MIDGFYNAYKDSMVWLINQIDYLYKHIVNIYDINPTGIHRSG